MTIVRAHWVLLLCSVFAASAVADIVTLKDGKTLEGEITAQSKTSVTVQTRFGKRVLDRSKIKSIEIKATPAQELAEREAALSDPGADDYFGLAEFAQANQLKKDYTRLIKRTLQADPNHKAANLAMGHVLHDGVWMTVKDRDLAVEKQQLADMAERGLVEYEGRWVTPEERENLSRGLVLYQGEWLPKRQAMALQGLHEVNGHWYHESEASLIQYSQEFLEQSQLPLEIETSKHFVIMTPFGEQYNRELAEKCERAFVVAAEIMGVQANLGFISNRKIWMTAFVEREDFKKFVAFFATKEKKTGRSWADSVSLSDGFYWWDPSGTSATYKGPRIIEQVTGRLLHQLGHVFLNFYQYNYKYLPHWLDEGFAALIERDVMGENSTTCISPQTKGGYGRTQEERKKQELLPGGAWVEEMMKKMARGEDPPLAQIFKRDFSTLQADDVIKAMLVVHYFRTQDQKLLPKFLTKLREVWPTGLVDPNTAAAQEAHKQAMTVLEMDAATLDRTLRKHFTKR